MPLKLKMLIISKTVRVALCVKSLLIYFTEFLKTNVQLLQNVHGVDIAHDNVFSSMLSCFFSYVAATLNRASYF